MLDSQHHYFNLCYAFYNHLRACSELVVNLYSIQSSSCFANNDGAHVMEKRNSGTKDTQSKGLFCLIPLEGIVLFHLTEEFAVKQFIAIIN